MFKVGQKIKFVGGSGQWVDQDFYIRHGLLKLGKVYSVLLNNHSRRTEDVLVLDDTGIERWVPQSYMRKLAIERQLPSWF